MSIRALLIDNYDSFTFNLARYLKELMVTVDIIKNDVPTPSQNTLSQYDCLIISPGPGKPTQSGHSITAIKACLSKKPILGICLGHQCIAHVLGAQIVHASSILHGKVSRIKHNFDPLFANIPQHYNVTRYHSLAVELSSLPSQLAVCAWSGNEIMAIKDLHSLTYGVQFHPEAFLTEYGHQLLTNFLTLVKQNNHESIITDINRQTVFT